MMHLKDCLYKKSLSIQLGGYLILLILIIVNEVFDFPHRLFGTVSTPVNLWEIVLEASFLVVSAAVTTYLTLLQLKRIKLLEGYLPICSECKKIRTDDSNWVSIEKYITERSEAVFTHGMCPDCAEKYLNE